MKPTFLIPLLGAAMIVTLSSCGNGGASLSGQNFNPSTNPLDSPGSRSKPQPPVDTGPRHKKGTWVEVTDVNASFYRKFPKGDAQPDSALPLGAPLKVVGEQGSYVKVETEGGQIGYVPAIMVADKSSEAQIPIVPIDDILPAPSPIDPVDPGGVPAPAPDLRPTPAPSIEPDLGGRAPEPEVPPISVEEANPPPVVPPDPLD